MSTAIDRIMQLATSDAAAALAAAKRIDDPWVACQTLAWVARFAPDDQVLSIVDQAFKAGRRAEDPYQVVGSAAWPLRALVERGRSDRLRSILPDLKGIAARIESPASRCEALLLVYQGDLPGRASLVASRPERSGWLCRSRRPLARGASDSRCGVHRGERRFEVCWCFRQADRK